MRQYASAQERVEALFDCFHTSGERHDEGVLHCARDGPR